MNIDANESILPIPLTAMKILGLWMPQSFTGFKKSVYQIYTGIMMSILITTALAVMIAVINMPSSAPTYLENVFLMFALFNATFKATNILASRESFIDMLNISQADDWRIMRNDQESNTYDSYAQTIRKISKYFTTAVMIAIFLRIVQPLIVMNKMIILPVDAYVPCNYTSSKKCYWTAFVHQAIGTSIATLIHASKDSIISGFLLTTCSQLALLKLRLIQIPEICRQLNGKVTVETVTEMEGILVSECVKHHQSIFKFADTLNDSLSVMLFGQVATTIPNLCLSVFLLSTTSVTSVEFAMTIQFLSAVVIELFFFCWYGNEVTLHSLNVESAFREMNWTMLSIKSQKDLIMIMMRTTSPIRFRVGPIMNMNIESFLKIMKTSYSVFSVLQSRGN